MINRWNISIFGIFFPFELVKPSSLYWKILDIRVNPGIEGILEKLTLRILLSKIGPQNFSKVVYMNENALRSLNLGLLGLILLSHMPIGRF